MKENDNVRGIGRALLRILRRPSPEPVDRLFSNFTNKFRTARALFEVQGVSRTRGRGSGPYYHAGGGSRNARNDFNET